MLVDVGKDPIGSLLGLHGLHRTSSDQRPAPGPRRIIDFVHDALADGRRLRILRVIDQWSRHSPLLEGAARPSRTRSVGEALDYRVPFGTNAELVACIAYTFGIRIPAISCCTAHCSPAQSLRGRAPRLFTICASYGSLERSDDTGARSGLEFFGTADLLAMRFRPISETVHSRCSERFVRRQLKLDRSAPFQRDTSERMAA